MRPTQAVAVGIAIHETLMERDRQVREKERERVLAEVVSRLEDRGVEGPVIADIKAIR